MSGNPGATPPVQVRSNSPSRAPETKAPHSAGVKIREGLSGRSLLRIAMTADRAHGDDLRGRPPGPLARAGQESGGSEPTSHMEKNCEPPP
ncbi:hypothetical protein ACE1SV_04240 [Streptomyces sp. E-15]